MNKVLVIDGDEVVRSQMASWLKERGWSHFEASDNRAGMELALRHQPEIIFCDLLTPGCNGAQFCRDLRVREDGDGKALIVATGNDHATEKYNVLEAGANAFLEKPVRVSDLEKILERFGTPPIVGRNNLTPGQNGDASSARVRIKFWGVRGSIPSPGPETVFYGGNTSCIEVRVGSDIIVLDAGSGIRRLGLSLVEEFKDKPMQLNLLITHTHWDHIQGFPFFLPAYDPKNKLTIYGFEGATQGLQGTLSSQMESPYFPISMQQMPGHIVIREMHDLNFNINQVPVRAHFLNHPGNCTGYRLETPGGSVSYLPDIELYQRLRNLNPVEKALTPDEDKKLIEFIRDSDVLILDSQYDAAEYEKHVGWGHSCVEDSVAFALHANVKRLFLFHHDPDHTDEQISRMVARARQVVTGLGSSLSVEGAREGCELFLTPKKA